MDSPFKTYIYYAGVCYHARKYANFEEGRLNRAWRRESTAGCSRWTNIEIRTEDKKIRNKIIHVLESAEDSLKSLEGKENTMTTSCLDSCIDDFNHIYYAGVCYCARKYANFEEVRLNRVISVDEWWNFKDKRHAFDVRRGYLIKFMSKLKKVVKELKSKEHLKVWHDFVVKCLEKRVNSVIDRLDVRDGQTSTEVEDNRDQVGGPL
uniref:Uncharacterized protein n=1 Tax=Meloidogyne incognita TaxID=6306 RepID=A0A914L4M6_MELIC